MGRALTCFRRHESLAIFQSTVGLRSGAISARGSWLTHSDRGSVKIKNAFQIGLLGGLGVLLAIAIGTAVVQVQTVLLYAFAAIFIALGVEPAVQFLIRRGLPRWAALLTLVVVILGALTGLMLIIIPVIVGQFSQLVQSIVDNIQHGALDDVREWLQDSFPAIDVDGLVATTIETLGAPETWTSLPPWLATIVQGVFGALGQIAFAAGSTFIVVVLMLFFVGSMPTMKASFYKLIPASRRPKFESVAEQIMSSVGRFVMGQFFLGLTNGILSFIVLTIAQVELAAVFAFMAFVASLIPLVGTITASIVISGLVALLDDPIKALWILGYYLIYMQVEAYGISPQIMKRAVRIPPVVVVVAALVGGSLLGILGALVAVPLAAAVQLILKEYVLPRQAAR